MQDPAGSLGTQLIVDPVASAPVDLGRLTGGLVGGTTAIQLANVTIAPETEPLLR